MEFTILIFLIVSWSIQLLVWGFVFNRIRFSKDSNYINPTEFPDVSVVICAHNEAVELKKNLSSIAEQDYPNFEIIIVNDSSTDDTPKILDELAEQYSHIKILSIQASEKSHGGKKQAIQLGISGSNHDLLLFTDADCQASSKNWISTTIAHFSSEKHIVLGYSPYRKKEGFLNAFIRFETMQIGLQYFSTALIGLPYMGTGRNLAYKKSIYMDHQPNRHMDLLSGDDDLVVNQLSNKFNTAVNLNSDSFMLATPKSTWLDFFKQKRRHMTAGARYALKHKLMLASIQGSALVFYLSLVYIIFVPEKFVLAIILWFSRCFLQLFVWLKTTKVLGNRDLIFFTIFLDVVSVFFNSFVFISNYLKRSSKWK